MTCNTVYPSGLQPEQIARYRHVQSMVHDDDQLTDLLPSQWRGTLTRDLAWPELAAQLRTLVDHDDQPERCIHTCLQGRALAGSDSPARALAWRLAPICATAAGGRYLSPPPGPDDTSELTGWLRDQHERVMTLAANAEPRSDWRRVTPIEVQDEITIWRAENNWDDPDQALPPKPPSQARARQGWRQLQTDIARLEHESPARAPEAEAPVTPEERALATLERLRRRPPPDRGLEL